VNSRGGKIDIFILHLQGGFPAEMAVDRLQEKIDDK
jgi:hypothetical protein